MLSNLGKRKWWIAAIVLAACGMLWNPIRHVVFAARFAVSLQKLAAGDSGRNLAVQQTRIHRQSGGQEYAAMLYHPTRAPASKAIILAAGISELGCYHPRLVALSRFLADSGFMVLTPDIREFREFQISARPIEQILFWHRQVPALAGSHPIRKTGLAGISFSGTLALIAAARPEIRDSIGFAVAVGPYANLAQCTANWFAADPGAVAGRYYPTRFYAKWVIMLAALDMLESRTDRSFLREVLNRLMLQQTIPPASAGLSAEGARWYRLATMHEDQSDPQLAADIETYLTPRLYRQLDPGAALRQLRCPVFLIHGAHDDLIPPGESVDLHRKITNSQLLLIPFLTHTHPTGKALSRGQKAKAALEALAFCYSFSRAIE